jgi:AAA domain
MTEPTLKEKQAALLAEKEALAKIENAAKLDSQLAGLTRNAADLQTKTFEPLRWIVPDIWPEGLSMLVGKPKVGKSWMALDVAIAVASGGLCLGKECEQGDVLALFLEDNDRRLQQRMTLMLGAQKEKWPDRLTYATEWPRLADGGIDLIRKWVDNAKKPRLIIVDILERVRKRIKHAQASQYSSDYDALTSLHTLASEAQLSSSVLHHQRKMGADDLMDTISGTGGLGGSLDTLLVLGKDETGHFLYGRGRDLEEFNIAVRQDERCRWENLGWKPETQVSAERTLIVAALFKAGRPMNVSEIAAAVPNMKPVNVKNLLPQMQKDGDIESVSRGVYRLPDPQGKLDIGGGVI